MPTVTKSFPAWFSNTTDFRIWGQNIASLFTGAGLVKTADTGQIDWTTVSMPASVNSNAGYEIYRFDDTLQATVPIFIKITYGMGNNGQTIRLILEVGSGTNGSGTITGVGAGQSFTIPTASSTPFGNNVSHWASSDGSGFVFVHALDFYQGSGLAPQNRYVFVVDRNRNADGTPSASGLSVLGKSGSTGFTHHIHDRVNTTFLDAGTGCSLYPTPTGLLPATTGLPNSITQENGEVLTSPYFALIPGTGLFRLKMLVSISAAELGAMANVSILHLGANRTFRSLGQFQTLADSTNSALVSAMVWVSD